MRKDMTISMITVQMINIHHIVGVPAFQEWSLANSLARPINHSSRICLPSFSLLSNLIPIGMSPSVITKEAIRDASMKKRLYTGR
jgi:hypothetical protein